jgi:hypothetical protein
MVSASDGWAVGISILHYTGPAPPTQTAATATSAAPTVTTATGSGTEGKLPSIPDMYMVFGALVVVLVVAYVVILVRRKTIRRAIPE